MRELANAWFRKPALLRALLGCALLWLPAAVAQAHPQAAYALEGAAPSAVFVGYLRLGAEHLVFGLDHLLFVVGLLLLVSGLRARLLSLTAFTLGHSLTLGLSALSIIELPQRPVEIGIALSLLVLALELVAQQRQASVPRRPWLMAVSFGLLHGLGFASALAETGLPSRAITLALFSFNLGVELAQLLVALALVPLASFCARALPDQERRFRALAAYGLAVVAAVWCVQRALFYAL